MPLRMSPHMSTRIVMSICMPLRISMQMSSPSHMHMSVLMSTHMSIPRLIRECYLLRPGGCYRYARARARARTHARMHARTRRRDQLMAGLVSRCPCQCTHASHALHAPHACKHALHAWMHRIALHAHIRSQGVEAGSDQQGF